MNDRTLTSREEARLIKAAQDVLMRGAFPNPERSGCPDEEILRAIASRKLSLELAADWSDHLGFCSPCFAEYDALRRQMRVRRRIRFAALAACIALGVFGGIWLWFAGWRQHTIRGNDEMAYALDLRNRVAFRGEGPAPVEAPLEIPRGRLFLTVYLPLGSEAGEYDFAIAQQPGTPLIRAGASATLREGVAAFNVKVNLESMRPGPYFACIRRTGLSWRYYRVELK